MTMTPQQFNLLADLLRSKEPVTSGVKMILFKGMANADAARAVGVSPQSVHRATKRFIELDAQIRKIYK